MSFSSDIPQITNQLPFTINLPPISKGALFQDALEHMLRYISSSLNQKEAALYTQVEQGSGQQYYIQNNTGQFRNVYRLTMNFINLNGGNIPVSGVPIPFPHNMKGVLQSAGITANCTDTNGTIFTVVYPFVYINATTAFFINPSGFPLTQADIIINILKQTQVM